MIKVVCDNCGKELRDKPSQMEDAATFKPEKHVTLKMHVQGTESYPLDVDLCVNCAKKYLKVLKDPV